MSSVTERSEGKPCLGDRRRVTRTIDFWSEARDVFRMACNIGRKF